MFWIPRATIRTGCSRVACEPQALARINQPENRVLNITTRSRALRKTRMTCTGTKPYMHAQPTQDLRAQHPPPIFPSFLHYPIILLNVTIYITEEMILPSAAARFSVSYIGLTPASNPTTRRGGRKCRH